ncbi:cadherin-like and PC-esterase domain-containing protein 1 [Leptotrombidium deliense]|uniref:Cadherin-like and PC-esterase domain-containing protein 1 n=1 Tax=Leptotrombidium deliense TaxID=299467 RepID=A0A443SAL7_9ACAR|nr:cadherin-like and PC-esterase domain-containing protein 1 [Leptotrombidium deliense]
MNISQINGRTWMLSYFWQFIAKQFGHNSVKKAMRNIHRTLVQILLVAEAMLVTQSNLRDENNNNNAALDDWTIIKRCTTCFQLIAVDLMLNSTFDPFVLEFSSQPNMQEANKDELFVLNKVKKVVLDDFVNIITASTTVSSQVTDALEEVLLENSVGVMGISCLISHEMCLSHSDLQFLIQTRKEALNKGKFRKLYPDVGTEIHKELIDELSAKIIGNSVNNDLSFHKTADLHPLLMALERHYAKIARFASKSYANNYQESRESGANNVLHSNTFRLKNNLGCSEDSATLPYLSSIELHPKLTLSPPFSPYINQYFANASYDQLLITVFAKTQNCQSEVRIDDKFGPSRPTNYTLGIGLNKVTFFIVDISHTEPWVISSYTLHINRLHPKHNEMKFNSSSDHQICSLKQDCDLRVFEREECGLRRENGIHWKDHLKSRSSLPSCESGTASGKWVLPCQRCDQKWTCYWNQARWEPDTCQHKLLSSTHVSKCLENKKILFVGDSTNRGIMHYLIERLNGSLTDSDKTHNIRVYNDLNRGKTVIAFTYYPKFWLPSNQRPAFDKTLLQLLERVQPFENNSNIVIVFGGVQWLAVQHIHMLLATLSK